MYTIQTFVADDDGDFLEIEPSASLLTVLEFDRLRDAERAAKALRSTRKSNRFKYHVVKAHDVTA